MAKIKPSKEELEDMYLIKFMSTYEIAEMYGVSNVTIGTWLVECGIAIRTASEAKLKGKIKPTRKELEDMYIVNMMTTVEISKIYKLNPSTIGDLLKSYDIQIRHNSEAKLKGKIKPTREELINMYLEQNLSLVEIGTFFGISNVSIRNWMKQYDIPTRNLSEARLKGKIKPTREELVDLYVTKSMSLPEIGLKLDVAHGSIKRWLVSYGITLRTISEAKLNGKLKLSKEELDDMYSIQLLSTMTIAEQHGVDHTTISEWLKEYNIQMRTAYERSLKGETNPNWRGGPEKYCSKFNENFKERVRIFFGRICFNCKVPEAETGRKLSVHHVTYEKLVCCNDTKPLFVPLCHSCHSKTNHKREYWEDKFTTELMKQTNGECYLPLD